MPTYTLDGLRAGNRNITPATVEVDFKRGSDSLSYEVIPSFEGGDYIRVTSGNVRTISLNGTELSGDTPGSYFSVVWGAGLFTEVFGLELLDGRDFAAFLSGAAVPAALAAGGDLANEIEPEFVQSIVVNEYLSGGAGPIRFAPDTDVPLDAFFTQDFENIETPGTEARDVLKGTGRADLLTGLAGNDVLKGRGGDDTIFTGRGNDKAAGGGGSDLITGFGGKDKLNGQGGADVIVGGKGDDVLKGGRGADIFVFGRGDDDDTVRDFGRGDDTLLLDPSLWRGFLEVQEIVDTYGETQGDDFVLDFGKRGSITLDGAGAREGDVVAATEVLDFFFG